MQVYVYDKKLKSLVAKIENVASVVRLNITNQLSIMSFDGSIFYYSMTDYMFTIYNY